MTRQVFRFSGPPWAVRATRSRVRLRGFEQRWVTAGLILAAVGCFIYCLTAYPRTGLVWPDTITYLRFAWYRPPGYGLLVHGLGALTGSVYSVVLLQLALSLGSGIVFASTLGRLLGSWVLTLSLGLVLILHGPMRGFDMRLLTESPCLSCMLLCLSCGLGYWQSGKSWQLGLGAWLMVVAMLLRPTSVILALPLLLCWLGAAKRRWRPTSGALLPACIVLAAWLGTNYYRFHRATPFMRGGDVLLAGTAHQLKAGLQHPHAELTDYYARTLQPTRDAIARARGRPSEDLYAWFKHLEKTKQRMQTDLLGGRDGYAAARQHLLRYVRQRRSHLCQPSFASGNYELLSCLDQFAKELARQAIAGQPGAYAQHVVESLVFYALRTHELDRVTLEDFEVNTRLSPRDKYLYLGRDGRYRGVLETGFEVYPSLDRPPWLLDVWPRVMRQRVAWDGRGLRCSQLLGLLDAVLLSLTAVLSTLLLGVRLLRRQRPLFPRSPWLIVAAVLSSTYLTYYLAYATHHPAVQRYAVAMEPIALAAWGAALLGGFRLLRAHLPTLQRAAPSQ